MPRKKPVTPLELQQLLQRIECAMESVTSITNRLRDQIGQDLGISPRNLVQIFRNGTDLQELGRIMALIYSDVYDAERLKAKLAARQKK